MPALYKIRQAYKSVQRPYSSGGELILLLLFRKLKYIKMGIKKSLPG